MLGDNQYGKKNIKFRKINQNFLNLLKELKGQTLHAKTLKFIHHMVEDSTGDVIMDIEIVAVLFDLKKRKSVVVPEEFRLKASKLFIDN